MDFQVKQIINNLSETFEGMPWHGNSLKDLLANVDAKMAFYRPFQDKHTIAELLAHILVWRQFVLEILDKNYDFNVDIGSMADFPPVAESDRIWQELLTQLTENQAFIVKKLTSFSDDDLDKMIPKKPFSFRFLFEGIIYHDVYHGGQIGLIKSAYITSQFTNEDIIKKATFY